MNGHPDSTQPHPWSVSAQGGWETLVTASPSYILIVDHDDRVLFCNRPLPGLEQSQMAGASLPGRFDPQARDALRTKLHEVRTTVNTVSLEVSYRTAEREWVFLALLYPMQESTDVIVELRDNTALRRQRSELDSKSQLLNTAMDSLPIVIWAFDRKGIFTFSQGSALQALGLAADEVVGQSVFELYRDYPQVIRSCKRALEGEPVSTVAEVHGRVFHAHYQPVFIDDQVRYVIGVASDITDVAAAQSQMRILSSALEQTADLVMITDREGRIEYVNPAFEQTTGYRRDEVVNRNPSILRSDKQSEDFFRALWDTITRGRPYNEIFINKRKDGSLYYEEKTITPIRDPQGQITHFVATGRDVSDRMRDEKQLRRLSHHDTLTRLPNRNLLLDRLKHSMARARWHKRLVAVMVLDLDDFKRIKDRIGQQGADRIVVQLTQRLASSVRAGDTVARAGGDAFAILLDDIASEQDISTLAKKILGTLALPFKIDEQEWPVTASLGISIFPSDAEDSETLLRNADVAMYRAKELGGNNFQFFSSEMSARVFERLTLENSLRYALERNEFFLRYQPQVDARDGTIIGVEAVVRWQHPELGPVQPSEFIPLLEETGLIVPVGEWILKNACTQARRWHEAGFESLFVSVNLSSRQFDSPDFIGNVQSIIADTGIDPQRLELELTESMLMRNASKTINALDTLNEMGVRIAVDDFGTGYSSLNYLRRFPIDTLKIDRTFIRDVTEDPDDAAITTAIIVMAQSLNLTVIAEGVEDEAQMAFLQNLDCHFIQGNYFSPALKAEEVTERLSAGATLESSD